MNTDRNHNEAKFTDIANRTMFLRQKTAKTSFPKRLEFKDIADVCLGFFKAFSIDFVREFK